MADRYETVWPLQAHTKAKHEILKRYLNGWYPVLSKYNGRIIFLDGFAGPGIYKGGEPGSPTVAINTLLDHNYELERNNCEFLLVFNEQEDKRYEVLKEIVNELKKENWPSHVKVEVLKKNFQDMAQELVSTLAEQKAKLAPTLAFLDPFGYKDTPIELICQLLSFDKCELLIYFDYNSVNRFGTAGNVDHLMEPLFGTDEFKNAPPAGNPGRGPFFVDLYERQLRDLCNFKYVQRFEMINEDGRTPYYLFYCTRNIKGLEIMKDAMWAVDPTGSYQFSDKLSGQSILFQDNPDTQPLRRALLAQFAGQTVPVSTLEEFTLVRTPYKKTHLKRQTLAGMQRDGVITSPNQRKRNTFPEGTLIEFPPSPEQL